jgi:UDP-N-acetylmuramyl pentapeptide phosphotransferase/UDP-N-acetylglucosamine-1-phosphate transferase
MELWSSAFISLFLLACAAGLMVWHIRAWRSVQTADVEASERDYRRRQFRRRMQTSAMLGLLAVAIFVGQVLTLWLESHWCTLIFWGGVLLMLMWVGLLAGADVVATRYHYGRLRHEYFLEQVKLRAELDKIQKRQSNGKARRGQPPSG